MGILKEDGGDPELLVIAMTLINKIQNGIPDQDTYYDVVDSLEEQGVEEAIRRMGSIGNGDVLEQCRIYEDVLSREDSATEAAPATDSVLKRVQNRTVASTGRISSRRKSNAVEQHQPYMNGHAPDSGPVRVLDMVKKNDQQIHDRMSAMSISEENESTQQTPKIFGVPRESSQDTPGLPADKRVTMELLYKKDHPVAQMNGFQDSDQDSNADENRAPEHTWARGGGGG